MSAPLLRLLNRSYQTTLAPAWARFQAAAFAPKLAQRAKLIACLDRAQGTVFARDYGLARVRTIEDFRQAVPILSYDDLRPYVERMLRGERGILTNQEPKVFEPTSGSTVANKFVPYSPALLDEFSAATGPWLFDLLSNRPALRTCSSYWSISPSRARGERSAGGTPIGFEDDTEYFPAAVRQLLRQLLPVPAEVAQAPDVEACRYLTLRYLLADPNVGLVSVWSPSFLTLLLEFAREHAERLADDVERGTLTPPGGAVSIPLQIPAPSVARAHAIRGAFPASGPLDLRRVWPKLSLVSCWTDAAARQQLPALLAQLPPSVEVQSKGLLATEGVVSFPLLGHEGAALAVASHLIELRPLDGSDARPVLPHEAELGGRYQPILTTGGGFWRYPLGDEVEVVGRYLRTPLVRFRGRIDGVSDLCGEKLAPARVEDALDAALADVRASVQFRLLTPTPGQPPCYTLYAEGEGLERLPEALDARLREGHHYELCRQLGQLDGVRVQSVDRGWERYERALVERGQKAGNIKPPGLHTGSFWADVFEAPGRLAP